MLGRGRGRVHGRGRGRELASEKGRESGRVMKERVRGGEWKGERGDSWRVRGDRELEEGWEC